MRLFPAILAWHVIHNTRHDTIQVHSDASGTIGGRALTSDNKWLQVQWPASWQDVDISIKEMAPIVLSEAMWGRSLHWRRVFFYFDNMSVVLVIQRKSAKQCLLLHLLRALYSYASHFSSLIVHIICRGSLIWILISTLEIIWHNLPFLCHSPLKQKLVWR